MTNFAKKRSQLQERRIAEDLGGQVQKNSGATDFAKGDVRVQGQLGVEAKHTSKKSFTLSLADIMKIRNEALSRGESWVMQVEFVGQVGMSQKVAVLNWDEYVELRNDQAFAQRFYAHGAEMKAYAERKEKTHCGECGQPFNADGMGNLYCATEGCQP